MCIPEGVITQIEEGKTMQWSKENGQKDQQLSTKHHTKQDLATRTALKIVVSEGWLVPTSPVTPNLYFAMFVYGIFKTSEDQSEI